MLTLNIQIIEILLYWLSNHIKWKTLMKDYLQQVRTLILPNVSVECYSKLMYLVWKISITRASFGINHISLKTTELSHNTRVDWNMSIILEKWPRERYGIHIICYLPIMVTGFCLYFRCKRARDILNQYISINIEGSFITQSREPLRNLGFSVDQISKICKSVNYNFYIYIYIYIYIYLRIIKTYMHTPARGSCTVQMMSQLQRCRIKTDRILFSWRKFDHIRSVLKDLHCLPGKQRIDYDVLRSHLMLGTASSLQVPVHTPQTDPCDYRFQTPHHSWPCLAFTAPSLWNFLPTN